MASEGFIARLQDTYLSCAICFQVYSQPKALPCLHTFCEGCLRDYVASRFEGLGQFPCPLCRQIIHIPPGGVRQFPDNHFIVGLGDTVQQYNHKNSDGPIDDERIPLLPDSRRDHFVADSPHKLVRRLGEFGKGQGQFVSATGIAVSTFTDDMFVSDSALNRIYVFSSNSQLRHCFQCDCSIRDIAVTRSGSLLVTVSQAGNALLREYTVEGKIIGSYGTFYSQEQPYGLAISPSNQPIVTGLRQNTIHVLTSQFKPSIRFGSKGRGDNHFTNPYFLATNSRGDIIVSDCGNNRIKTHTMDGKFLHAFGVQGSKPGQLFYPMGICVDVYDNVYVADANNYRVQVFTARGECLVIPVKDTYQYGIDVKPTNVRLTHDNTLAVLLRGSKFCQIHFYTFDVHKYKPVQQTTLARICPCW